MFLEYARDGRNSGVAYAGYKNSEDNIAAVNKFDGRKAIGQVIDVELIKPLVIGSARPSSDGRSTGRRPAGRRDDEEPRERRAPKPKKTAQDLDKELEAYMDSRPFPAASSASGE